MRLAPLWAAIAWGGAALGLVVSLWPGGVPLPVPVWDKLEHATGYFLLAGGFLGIYPRRHDLAIAGGVLLFGIGIEALQALTPTRSAEFGDVLADALGIGLALGLARAGFGEWALRFERRLGLRPR